MVAQRIAPAKKLAFAVIFNEKSLLAPFKIFVVERPTSGVSAAFVRSASASSYSDHRSLRKAISTFWGEEP